MLYTVIINQQKQFSSFLGYDYNTTQDSENAKSLAKSGVKVFCFINEMVILKAKQLKQRLFTISKLRN